MKRRKRLFLILLSIVLAAVMITGFAVTALAAEVSEAEEPAAEEVSAEEAAAEDAVTEEVPGEEVPAAPYVIDHVTWVGSTLTFEDPEYMPEAVYRISFVYSYISMTDLTTLRYMDGEVSPEFGDGVWHYDFSKVVDFLPDLTMGKLSYFISVIDTDPRTAHRSNANAYQDEITVHVVMDPVWNTVDANGQIEENGGTITRSGNGQFFDGQTIDLFVQENEGYRLSLLAHKKGSMTSFSLDEDDDLLYMITGTFTKVARITLEAGDEAAAAGIASKHTVNWDNMNLFVYDGGTSLTYYAPYGADRGSFYYSNILQDCREMIARSLYRGIAPRTMDAYTSQEEVDADMNSLSPVITEGGTYYILWARPAGACDVTIEPIAAGTKVTSRKQGDATIQDPAPKATCTGNYELKAGNGSPSAAFWLDEEFKELNGTVGSSGCYVCFELDPKFGYYIDDPSKITVNGQSLLGNFSFGSFIVGYARVGAPGSTGSVFGGGAGTVAASLISAAAGLGAGVLLGRRKKKTGE